MLKKFNIKELRSKEGVSFRDDQIYAAGDMLVGPIRFSGVYMDASRLRVKPEHYTIVTSDRPTLSNLVHVLRLNGGLRSLSCNVVQLAMRFVGALFADLAQPVLHSKFIENDAYMGIPASASVRGEVFFSSYNVSAEVFVKALERFASDYAASDPQTKTMGKALLNQAIDLYVAIASDSLHKLFNVVSIESVTNIRPLPKLFNPVLSLDDLRSILEGALVYEKMNALRVKTLTFASNGGWPLASIAAASRDLTQQLVMSITDIPKRMEIVFNTIMTVRSYEYAELTGAPLPEFVAIAKTTATEAWNALGNLAYTHPFTNVTVADIDPTADAGKLTTETLNFAKEVWNSAIQSASDYVMFVTSSDMASLVKMQRYGINPNMATHSACVLTPVIPAVRDDTDLAMFTTMSGDTAIVPTYARVAQGVSSWTRLLHEIPGMFDVAMSLRYGGGERTADMDCTKAADHPEELIWLHPVAVDQSNSDSLVVMWMELLALSVCPIYLKVGRGPGRKEVRNCSIALKGTLFGATRATTVGTTGYNYYTTNPLVALFDCSRDTYSRLKAVQMMSAVQRRQPMIPNRTHLSIGAAQLVTAKGGIDEFGYLDITFSGIDSTSLPHKYLPATVIADMLARASNCNQLNTHIIRTELNFIDTLCDMFDEVLAVENEYHSKNQPISLQGKQLLAALDQTDALKHWANFITSQGAETLRTAISTRSITPKDIDDIIRKFVANLIRISFRNPTSFWPVKFESITTEGVKIDGRSEALVEKLIVEISRHPNHLPAMRRHMLQMLAAHQQMSVDIHFSEAVDHTWDGNPIKLVYTEE